MFKSNLKTECKIMRKTISSLHQDHLQTHMHTFTSHVFKCLHLPANSLIFIRGENICSRAGYLHGWNDFHLCHEVLGGLIHHTITPSSEQGRHHQGVN